MQYFTNDYLNHGLGSIFHKLIILLGYAYYLEDECYEYKFVYSPLENSVFKNDIHNHLGCYFHDRNADFVKEYTYTVDRWSKLVNIKFDKISKNLDVKRLVHPDLFDSEYDSYKNCYRYKEKIRENFILKSEKRDYTKVCIHVRRGDVTKENYPNRWLSDDYYLNIIEDIKKQLNGKEYKIIIHTQKTGFNESKFKNYNVIYDVDMQDNETWLDMVDSDILVLGKSSFSYGAAFITNGKVIYPEEGMFHPPMPDWFISNNINLTEIL